MKELEVNYAYCEDCGRGVSKDEYPYHNTDHLLRIFTKKVLSKER